MDPWVVWLVAAVVLAAGEIVTTSFYLGPFALGALAAAMVELAGGGSIAAWTTFVAVTAVAFAVVRPVARRHLRQPAQVRSGAAALVGRHAHVLERVDNDADVGTVKLEGEVWTARAYEDGEVFEPGARVSVVEIRGATALVTDD
jgi:membrane protein implicated in regulation of membrane protease activity